MRMDVASTPYRHLDTFYKVLADIAAYWPPNWMCKRYILVIFWKNKYLYNFNWWFLHFLSFTNFLVGGNNRKVPTFPIMYLPFNAFSFLTFCDLSWFIISPWIILIMVHSKEDYAMRCHSLHNISDQSLSFFLPIVVGIVQWTLPFMEVCQNCDGWGCCEYCYPGPFLVTSFCDLDRRVYSKSKGVIGIGQTPVSFLKKQNNK